MRDGPPLIIGQRAPPGTEAEVAGAASISLLDVGWAHAILVRDRPDRRCSAIGQRQVVAGLQDLGPHEGLLVRHPEGVLKVATMVAPATTTL